MPEKHETQVHGSLVEVRGLGMLILGPSAVGKSECVVELVRRGNRMVADDVVQLWRKERSGEPGAARPGRDEPDGEAGSADGVALFGRAPETIRHYIEIRGLGLLSVADLFGPESVLDECAIDFVCRLETRRKGVTYERIGLDRPFESILGVSLPTVTLPVQAAGNSATLVELAARDWKLRRSGINAARRLDEHLRGQGGILLSEDDSIQDDGAESAAAVGEGEDS